jgi:hypothetical protein
MVTTGLGQFEHSIIKYKEINKQTVSMLSGSPILFDDLINLKKWDDPFDKIKSQIFTNFKKKRKEMIKNEIFDKFMINESFFVDALNHKIENQLMNSIMKTIAEFSLETSILLIGIDEGVAKISVIEEDGYIDLVDINFHAIGSGADQATNTLFFQKHSNSENLSTAIYNVYKAKRNAEVKRGVGRETELAVLSGKKLTRLTDDHLKLLNKVYTDELNYGKNNKELKHICLAGEK